MAMVWKEGSTIWAPKKLAPTEEAAGASERHPMGWGARGRVPLSLSQAGGLAASIDQDQVGGKQQRGYDFGLWSNHGHWLRLRMIRRREFITLLGGAVAALPLAARAQQASMPVIGILSLARSGTYQSSAFHQGLSQAGFVEKRNVSIEYHWADGQYDRLPALAADLVRRQVGLIFATGLPAALAARAATFEIPIVFQIGASPIEFDLVASLSHPGGNVTGVTNLVGETNGIGRRLSFWPRRSR